MGALTLKTFPYELRGWDLEKVQGIDPTDGFGLSTKISLNNKQIIQIEPAYNSLNNFVWIHDKARQFFDSLNDNNTTNYYNFNKSWNITIKTLIKAIYLFELCGLKNTHTNYLIIIYENLSLNLLCLLTIYTNKYFFIKLKKSEKIQHNNNIESKFLINKKTNLNQINYSTLYLLMSTNLRFESSPLNLNVKQRILKGNFKCFIFGSFINLTYYTKFIGHTTTKIIKTITEGTHFVCQDIKLAKNPALILNSNLLKRHDCTAIYNILTHLNNFNNFIGLNLVSSCLFETGDFYINKPALVTKTDIKQFSGIYFINITTYSNIRLTKILKTNLIYYNKFVTFCIKKVVINQNYVLNNNLVINYYLNKFFDKYLYIPTKNFFETKDILLNIQGLVKSTHQCLKNNKKRSSWKIIRHIFNQLKNKLAFINIKTNLKLSFKLKNNKFKTFINLIYKTNKNLNEKSIFINNNLNAFFLKNNQIIKIKKTKFFNTKIKLWLNDFFIGGRDELSKNSLILVKCSMINRLQFTNFF